MVRTAGRCLRRTHVRLMHSTSGVFVCCLAYLIWAYAHGRQRRCQEDPVGLPSGRLEKTTGSSPHHMAQHHPTGSKTSPSYASRSSIFGSEPPSVEDDVDVWRYAIVSCMPETTTMILRSPKQQIWLRTTLCGGWCRRMALCNRELHARNDDDYDIHNSWVTVTHYLYRLMWQDWREAHTRSGCVYVIYKYPIKNDSSDSVLSEDNIYCCWHFVNGPTKSRISTVSVSCWTCSLPTGSSAQDRVLLPTHINTATRHRCRRNHKVLW